MSLREALILFSFAWALLGALCVVVLYGVWNLALVPWLGWPSMPIGVALHLGGLLGFLWAGAK